MTHFNKLNAPSNSGQSPSLKTTTAFLTITRTVLGRHPLDFYESPWWFTTEVLRYINISGTIGEPCAGHGAISSLLPHWKPVENVWTNDIDPAKVADYHLDATLAASWGQLPECDWIITNPPYGAATAPILQNAFHHSKVGVIMFLRQTFSEPCKDRADFLDEFPPSLVLVYPRYKFRKGSKSQNWSSESATISAYVWDKRTTDQRYLTRPASKIMGFYPDPDKAINFEDAVANLAAIQDCNVSTYYQEFQ